MKSNKICKKILALSIASIIISMPIFNSVYALEAKSLSNNYDLNLMSKYGITINERQLLEQKQSSICNDPNLINSLYSEKGIDLMKIEFQERFGTENNFKIVSKNNNVTVEVNGATGEIRTTTLNEEPITINYFEGIDKMKSSIDRSEKEVSPRYSLQNYYKSSGPDDLHLKVYVENGKSNKLVARNSKGSSKIYYKSSSSWNTGNTSILRAEIQSASNNWNGACKALNTAGTKALWNLMAAYVEAGSLNVPAVTIQAVLGTMGVATNLATAATRAANYLIDVNQANNAYSKL